jgi:hypothetical protein
LRRSAIGRRPFRAIFTPGFPPDGGHAHRKDAQVKRLPVLYLIASGAAPARERPELVTDLTCDWDTCVISTPEGSRFFDAGRIAEMTGHPVRTGFKDPDAPDILPRASAFAAAPATFNTINKWAAGISDTLALGLLNEAIGLGLPITAPAFTI